LPNSLDHMALISPRGAKRDAKAEMSSPSEGRCYSTPLALLYRIDADPYYHIPSVYLRWRHGPLYTFFALVRATDRTCVRVRCVDISEMREAVLAAYIIIKGSKV